MSGDRRIEFDLDEQRHCELCREAERLGVSPADVIQRALAAWLIDTEDDTLIAEDPGFSPATT